MDEYPSPAELVRELLPDVPVACFRPDAVETAASWFLHNFPGKILYALKANPSPLVVDALIGAGITAFDAASLPEIRQIAENHPQAEIAFMHPIKNRQAIERAYDMYGVRTFALDSLDELEKIRASTNGARDVTLIMRIAVPNTKSEIPLSGKFGIIPQESGALLAAMARATDRVGISFHVGSQAMDPQAYATALSLVRDILIDTKIDPAVIDVGGGFPSIYPDMQPSPLTHYLAAIKAAYMALPLKRQCELWAEPGRALVSESTSVVVRVDLRKGDALYINDGTYGSLFDAGQPAFRFPVRLIRPSGDSFAPLAPFRFFGPTCDSIDYMPGPFYLPNDIDEGDYIEVGQLGSYGSTMRTNFNGFYSDATAIVRDPPMVTMYDEDEMEEERAEIESLAAVIA